MLVDVSLIGDAIVIKKSLIQRRQPRKKIQELFEMYPSDFIEEEELYWSEPVGDEVW